MKLEISPADVSRCLLCYDAPCNDGCEKKLKPATILRSLRFSNYSRVFSKINNSCIDCSASCEKSCLLEEPVKIKKILSRCEMEKERLSINLKKGNLNANFCGIKLENPFILSSSVVASSYDMCKRAFEAGWAGVSFKTVSLIDIHEASPRYSAIKNLDGSILAFKNIEQLSDHSVIENLEIFRKLKTEFPTKLLLVSIMGRNEEEWKYLAKAVEGAGADAIELNFSCPNMVEDDTGSDVGQIPDLVYKYTKAAVDAVSIPVVAKLTPNVTSMKDSAIMAVKAGASGIAAINTIKSITELNLIQNIFKNQKNMNIAIGGLSGPAVKPIALRFIAELSSLPELENIHISAMGGVVTYADAIMYLALGAGSIQVTTAVMEYGYRIIDDLVSGLEYFIGGAGLNSVTEIQGLIRKNVVDIEKIERDYVIYPKFIKSKCIGCGRCYISCMDGGHQAICFENRIPRLDPKKCVGCHLCILVCPARAIESSEIKVKKEC